MKHIEHVDPKTLAAIRERVMQDIGVLIATTAKRHGEVNEGDSTLERYRAGMNAGAELAEERVGLAFDAIAEHGLVIEGEGVGE